MKKSLVQSICILVICLVPILSLGQSNDECVGAIFIDDPNSCGTYSLQGATASGFGAASCTGAVNGDVWFSFIPELTSITITINGNSQSNPTATLQAPVVTLYRGDCNGTINELRCGVDNGGSNFAEMTLNNVFVGALYLIRVDSRSAAGLGTFELCLTNFNQPADPGSDCFSSAFLCDKSSFTVQSVTGAGNDLTELNDATCVNAGGGNVEMNSTWFTWVAQDDGELEFTLTPLNAGDDLDFYLYELPNGRDNCSGKRLLRCMATGAFPGDANERVCNGPTGLRAGSVDLSEAGGCSPGDDNFIAPLDMQAGLTYALSINNFSGGGNGFEIVFGGNGEFRGPEPAFIMDPTGPDACLGSQITFTDASIYEDGDISAWAWTFGLNGDLETANGPGAHTVTYDAPGVKQIVLTVETDQGCIITDVQDVIIDPCCQTQNAINQVSNVTDSNCRDTNEGAINLAVSSNYGPHRILWDDGSSAPVRNNLFSGEYYVTVTGTFCDTVYNYIIDSPAPIITDTVIGMPTCDGGMNGSISLNPTGGTPGYEYLWNNTGTYVATSSLSNIPIGTYPVVIRDAIGCDDTLSIDVRELELLLVPGEQNVTMPTCNGFDNGIVELNISNGMGPYSYDFGDGLGFLTQNQRTNLTAAIYNVDVMDANRCRGQFSFEVTDHPALLAALDKNDISCNGEDDGDIMVTLSGGVGGYTYLWNTGDITTEIQSLSPGTYSLTATDANDCEVIESINIVEPGAIGVMIDDVTDVICSGDETGAIALSPIGGSGNFTYSIDGINFSSGTTFENLPAGSYTVSIRDINDCISTNQATIVEPPPLLVDAGMDQEINLAFETTISTTYSPPNRIVTYSWAPLEGLVCDNCASIIVSPFITTDYVVRIEDQTMCVAFDTVRIIVNDVRPIFVPNAFSPNTDGSNDRLGVYSNIAAINVDLFQVYDRWGSLVFEAIDLPLNDPSVGWDGTYKGKVLNTGVFIYQAKIRFLDNEVRDYSGDVTLLR